MLVEERLSEEILKTPTGDLRELLCDSNILILMLKAKIKKLEEEVANIKTLKN